MANETRRVLLNVASSTCILPGFINLDNSPFLHVARIYPIAKPFLNASRRGPLESFAKALRAGTVVVHDCRKPLPFRGATVGHVLCSHFLEHVYPDQAEAILRDFRRVLAPGGTVHLVMPDLAASVRRNLDAGSADQLVSTLGMTHSRSPSLLLRILGALGWEGLQHRWMSFFGSSARW